MLWDACGADPAALNTLGLLRSTRADFGPHVCGFLTIRLGWNQALEDDRLGYPERERWCDRSRLWRFVIVIDTCGGRMGAIYTSMMFPVKLHRINCGYFPCVRMRHTLEHILDLFT